MGSLGLSLHPLRAAGGPGPAAGDDSFDSLSRDLLRDWCDGMPAVQIHDPSDPAKHGALGCPACDFIHGRCMDAVYPFLHMAKVTGDDKYLKAGNAVFEWSKNVSQEDGSWTVIPDPKSWRGITVFGAIALADALHHHGDLLDAPTHQLCLERLGLAGNYIYQNFTNLDFSNINDGCTGIHAMKLLGRVLDRPPYLERSRQLASGLKDFLTKPSRHCGTMATWRGRSKRRCHCPARRQTASANIPKSPPGWRHGDHGGPPSPPTTGSIKNKRNSPPAERSPCCGIRRQDPCWLAA